MKKRILVVDNNPVILKLMFELLTRQGHEVTCAADGFGCLDVLADLQPDIIFLDLIMPQLGGDDLCRIIRSINTLQDCYIIIVSAVALEQEIDFRSLGADACIAKGPFKEMTGYILQAVEDADNPPSEDNSSGIRGADTLYTRQVTKELLKQNHHLKIILESMSQGIIEIDQQRILYLNPKAAEILRVDRERLLGLAIDRSLPRALLEVIERLPELPGGVCPEPVQFDGRQILVEQLQIRSSNPNQIIMLSDITERKKMEAVMEATNLSENIGYIFSGIRHEIGNPVNSIKMAISVLKRNLHEYDQETTVEFLDRSLQEVTRIEYLLKALKNYSLFEKPVMQVQSLSDFMGGFIALVKNDFEEKNITIQQIIPEQDVYLRTDSRALHHIMLNLMTNAADSLQGVDQPQIVISVGLVGSRVEIKVNDNGAGISEDEQQHLFKPFFTSKPSGTGLGLVIVQKMLSAIDGTIAIESYRDIGTTVTISLPGMTHG